MSKASFTDANAKQVTGIKCPISIRLTEENTLRVEFEEADHILLERLYLFYTMWFMTKCGCIPVKIKRGTFTLIFG